MLFKCFHEIYKKFFISSFFRNHKTDSAAFLPALPVLFFYFFLFFLYAWPVRFSAASGR